MKRVFEIGAYVLASALALGGGFLGADLLSGEGAVSGVTPAAERAPPPTNTTEIRNSQFGFAFRYPQDWGDGPRYHPSVRESVARADGVFCYVSVVEQKVASDASGKPTNLRRMMSDLKPAHFERMVLPGVSTKVESFEKTTLGGQDARAFVLDAKGNIGGTIRQGKLHGYATLRSYGAVFLICVAPVDVYASTDVQSAIRVAHTTFRFD